MPFIVRMKLAMALGSFLAVCAGTATAWAAPVPVTASPDGALLPVQVDAAKGRVLVTLPAPDADGVSGRYLFTQSIKTGLGSAAIRIDRGMQGETRLLAFRRMGGKVAVIFENPATGPAEMPQSPMARVPASPSAPSPCSMWWVIRA